MSEEFRPLPKSVTIGNSSIEGLGLIAAENIKGNTILGISHVEDKRFSQGYIRTALGAFINHNIKSNCRLKEDGDYFKLTTTKDVKISEELTLNYKEAKCGTYLDQICKINE